MQSVKSLSTILLLITTAASLAQSPLSIYTDHLVNGFQDWSWGGDNLTNSTPVHSGSCSAKHNGGQYNALSFEHPDFDATLYSNFSFWANGGSGGQIVQVFAQYGTNANAAATPVSFNLTATWQQFVIPLTTLGIANATNANRFTIQLTSATSTPFYVDDMQLAPKPAPALTHIGIDANNTIRTADARWFGVNTATWDGHLGDSVILPSLQEMGCLALRWPGGSTSDAYHWASDLAAVPIGGEVRRRSAPPCKADGCRAMLTMPAKPHGSLTERSLPLTVRDPPKPG